ncbi:glycoside hydrolase family 26 protein [Clostridium formicaceticum]|uniref:Endoglucanase n=1 Tax=Clostridium formicaceticum TaxID=1497 RepID=A0AAC9RHN5_9CLOT|nr:glycosyl hydrolase [Clostridium formicaceticum]AOY76751.1 endoglucanase [Clostridium formicaceticum]ARE87201.1 Endoglucanase H precursor [Clostridium formicaceticum]
MGKKIMLFLVVLIFCTTIVGFDVYASQYASTYIKNGQLVTSADYDYEDDFKAIKPMNNAYNQYTDYSHGYSINYPSHMWVDTSLSEVRTVIADEDTLIEIYYDDFRNTIHTADRYIHYSNQFKLNKKDHKIEKDQTIRVNGLRAHLLEWNRNKLEKLTNDKNYYVNVKIVKNSYEVYTIFIKSSKPIEDYMTMINSFHILEKKATPRINTTYKMKEPNVSQETRDFYSKYFLESDSLKWGIFEWSTAYHFDYLSSLEKRMDYSFEFIVRYQTLETNFPMEEMLSAYRNNKYVELTLQTEHSQNDNASVTYDLLNGKYDDFLNQYARDMKAFGHPVLFRLNNEMNGDWCVYSSYFSSNDTELFKAVWRYIYGIFKENGVDNALWVWNPHDISFPGFKWNHYLTYYPGDDYVDIIGLTGYNTGTYYKGEYWRGFNEVYDDFYEEYLSIFEYPFMITEFGASSIGGDKIGWIKDMFANIHRFDNIKVAIWWNGIDWDEGKNPARIYKLDETDEMLEVFRQGLQKYK